MTIPAGTFALALLASAGLVLTAAPLCAADEPARTAPAIKLEGEFNTARRAKLDAMQNKPFNYALLAGLKTWTGWTGGGEAPTSESLNGKPVILVTWSSWYKTSHEPMKQAQAIADSLGAGESGLIVLGVHHDRGWDRAADTAAALGLSVAYAHDAGNALRAELQVDTDPDFYLIDRAGNLRYADVDTGSVEAAAKLLLAETREDAARNALAAANAPSTPSTTASTDAAPGAGEAGGGFVAPAAAEYAAVSWPAHNGGNLYAKNFQGKALPSMGKVEWLSKQPDIAGRVRVVDMWATWCPPCVAIMPTMDKLQAEHKADLVVIGLSDEPAATVKNFLKKKPHSYSQAIDESGALKKSLGVQGIPHVAIVSSDGVIRWQGNPHEYSFKTTLASVISLDPGVKARRASSGDARKSGGGG